MKPKCPCCDGPNDRGSDVMGRKIRRRYCTKCSDPKNDRQVKGCPGCGKLFSYVPGKPRCDDCWSKRKNLPVEYEGRIPKTCICGCGEEINQNPRQVHRMRVAGMKLTEIAVAMDASYGTVKMWTRQFSKGKQGHASGLLGRRKNVDVPCFRCGKTVKAFPDQVDAACRGWCEGISLEAFYEMNWNRGFAKERAIRQRHRVIALQLQAEIPLSFRERQLINASGKRSLDKMHDHGIDAPYFDREDDEWPYYAAQNVVHGQNRRPAFIDREAS